MMRKVSFIFLIFMTFFIWHDGLFLHAEQMNVTDCLEADEDCLEEMDQPIEEIEDNTEENESELLSESETTPTSTVMNIVRMFFALLLVLALIYGISLLLKRKNKLYQQSDMLENLGGLPLGPNRSIQIVRVGSSIYMIGVGENVEMLEELKDEDVKRLLLYKEEESSSQASSFIQTMLKQTNVKGPSKSNEHFSEKLQNELKKLRFNRKSMIENHRKKDDEHD